MNDAASALPGFDEPSARSAVPVVLDTDIGTDVDDLLALILLADEPRIDLQAVTTVYGDTPLRARIANRVLRLMGRDDIGVHAGVGEPYSGRDVWWIGHEGRGIDELDGETVSTTSGVDALLAAGERHAGDLVVVAIGPLTNIAAALKCDRQWARSVRRLVVMGGEFSDGRPEHNVQADVVAARTVLASGIPSLFVGLDVTESVRFGESDLATATESGTSLAALVESQARAWWDFLGQPMCNPHDPIAALAFLEPAWFTVERSGWHVVADGDLVGAMEVATGPPAVEYASKVFAGAVLESLRVRLSAAIAREVRRDLE